MAKIQISRHDASVFANFIRAFKKAQEIAFNTAWAHGWYPADSYLDGKGACLTPNPEKIPEKLCLIHSEVSEALECYRERQLEEKIQYTTETFGDGETEPTGKPIGLPSELADIIIRVMDFAAWFKIDLAGAIVRKMEYNAQRSFKHGGKVI